LRYVRWYFAAPRHRGDWFSSTNGLLICRRSLSQFIYRQITQQTSVGFTWAFLLRWVVHSLSVDLDNAISEFSALIDRSGRRRALRPRLSRSEDLSTKQGGGFGNSAFHPASIRR
jgi:hypothetical protein